MHTRLAAVLTLALAACSAPSTNDLTVTPSITGASLALSVPATCEDPATGQITCWQYDGSFTLNVSLGDLASTPSNVTIEQFAVLLQASNQPLIQPLPLVGQKALSVGISQTQITTEAFHSKDLMAPTIDKAFHDRLCGGSLVVSGNVLDGARGKNVPVTSGPFTPSGCQ